MSTNFYNDQLRLLYYIAIKLTRFQQFASFDFFLRSSTITISHISLLFFILSISTKLKSVLFTNHGEKERKCSCGEVETEKIKAVGHTKKKKEACAATCTSSGLTEGSYCSVCNEDIVPQRTVSPLGHNWTSATCTQPKTCTLCGKKEGSTIDHDYNSTCKCDICSKSVAGNIKLPNTPTSISYLSSSNKKYTTSNITSVTGKVNYYYSSANYYTYDVTIKGSCTYNVDGNSKSSTMRIGYKLYDAEGYVVDSGVIYTETVAVGEKFSVTKTLYELNPGENYKMVFLNVN